MKVFSRSSIFTLVTKVVIMTAGIFTSVITAKTLGPEGRGTLVFILSFGLTIANFSSMGLPVSNTYLVGRNASNLGPLIINSIYISFFGGILATIITFVFNFKSPQIEIELIFIFFYVFFLMSQTFLSNFLVSTNQIKKYNIVELNNLLILVSYIYGFYFHKSVYYFLLSSLAGPIISVLLGIVYFRNDVTKKSTSFDLKLFKLGFKYSIRVYTTAIIYFAIIRGNVFIIKYLCNIKELGYYSIAMQIVDAMTMFSATIALLLLPYLLKQTETESKKLTIKILFVVGVVLILACLIILLTIKPLILLIFGSKFLSVVPIVYSSLPVILLLGVNSIVSQHIAANGYPTFMIWIWLAGFFIWIISSYFLIKIYAGVGAYLSLTITFLFIFTNILYKLKTTMSKGIFHQ